MQIGEAVLVHTPVEMACIIMVMGVGVIRTVEIRIGNPKEVGGIGMHACSHREVQLGHLWGAHLIRLRLLYLPPCLYSPIDLPWFTLVRCFTLEIFSLS